MLAAYRPVPETDWSVMGICGFNDFYSGIIKMTSIMSILGGLVMIIAFVLVRVAMSLSLKPLKRFASVHSCLRNMTSAMRL